MDNNVYIALSRQLALFRDMEVTAGNIANVNTTGYQASHVMFSNYMVKDGKKQDMNFSNDVATYRDTSKGGFQVTGNPLDVAIEGKGYFIVDTPLGTRYTRAGNFQVNAENTLVTAEGYPVLDQNNQRITFDETATDIQVGAAGNINVDGEEFANLGVVEFENEQLLQRAGDRMFSSDADPVISEGSTVLQGTLENSNVNGVAQLTHMIDISRNTTSTAKMIEVMYDLQRRNVTTWTKQA